MENVYYIRKDTLTSIADSLRDKTNTTDLINPTDMSKMIDNLSFAESEDLSAELTEQDILISNISAVLERRTATSEDNLRDELTSQDELISALSAILDTKLGV